MRAWTLTIDERDNCFPCGASRIPGDCSLLEQHGITLWTMLDLLMGALDARLDPHYRRARQLLPLRRFQNSWRLLAAGAAWHHPVDDAGSVDGRAGCAPGPSLSTSATTASPAALPEFLATARCWSSMASPCGRCWIC